MSGIKRPPVIIFDGDCSLCRSAVKFLDIQKSSSRFNFVPSSSTEADSAFQRYGIAAETSEKTMILIDDGRIYTKSTAVIRALQKKGGIWQLAIIFRLVPAPIRDWIYDRIALRRK